MRKCYLVCYDISDAKRLRRTLKLLRGYGEHWQYSVFFCVLKDIDRVRLQRDLEEVLNQKEDQTLIINLGGNEDSARRQVDVIGQKLIQNDAKIIVI